MQQQYHIAYANLCAGVPGAFLGRFKTSASTHLGAARKAARHLGLLIRSAGTLEDAVRYDSVRGQTCLFVREWDDDDCYWLRNTDEI